MSRVSCVFRGEETRRLTLSCCPDGVQVFSCQNEFVASEECVRSMERGEILQVIASSGLPACESCASRVSPVQLPSKNPHNTDAPSAIRQAWEERRRRRNPHHSSSTIKESVIIDCDTHGVGDAIVAAWIAEGTKDKQPSVMLYATGERAGLLMLLGQRIVAERPMIANIAQTFHRDQMLKGFPPRVYTWCASFGIDVAFARPQHRLRQEDIDDVRRTFSGNRPLVAFCPHANTQPRCWPTEHWEALRDELCDCEIIVIGKGGSCFDEWPNSYCGRTNWKESATLLACCNLVIGLDSAPIHLAGTLGVTSIALLGPTTDGIFSHDSNVHCMATERRMMPCVGCWYGWGFEEKCNTLCESLQRLHPEAVATKARELLQTDVNE